MVQHIVCVSWWSSGSAYCLCELVEQWFSILCVVEQWFSVLFL